MCPHSPLNANYLLPTSLGADARSKKFRLALPLNMYRNIFSISYRIGIPPVEVPVRVSLARSFFPTENAFGYCAMSDPVEEPIQGVAGGTAGVRKHGGPVKIL